MKELSIIIPTINREEILLETLNALDKLESKHLFEVIVILDKNSKEYNINWYDFELDITVHRNVGSGAASNRNFGVLHSKCNHILFLDDDIIIDDNALKKIIEFKNKNLNACLNPDWIYSDNIMMQLKNTAFGRFILNEKLINYCSWVHHSNWQEKNIFNVNVLSAFCLLVPKDIFNKVGGFNTAFKFQSVEDDEFSIKLKQANVPMYIDTKILVYHNEKDRINLHNRLKRLQIGAFNKRLAYEMGFKEYKLTYHPVKKSVLQILLYFKKTIFFVTNFIEKVNMKILDTIYFKLVHILIAIVIFEGYYLRKNK